MTAPDPYEEFRRAEIFFNAGQPAEAARILEPVIEAAPESTSCLELLARSQFASAQLGPAEHSLRELVSRRPDDAWAHFALARTLERLGRREDAEPHRRLAAALGLTED